MTALLTIGRSARAQPAPAVAPEPVEVVVTGTRTPESTQRATVRTDVITRQEAERRGATTVAEALTGQLGVQVNPGDYAELGGPSAIQIQGFDRDRVLVLEDGERVVGDVGGAIDLASLPLADVSRIEVVAGPMSALYGASAIGGVVNVVSAPPTWPGASGRVRLEGRSRRGVLAQGSGAFRDGDAWIAADASFRRQDGVPVDDSGDDLAVPDLTATLLGLRGGVRFGSRATARASMRWARHASEGRETDLVPGLGRYRVALPERTDRLSVHLIEELDLGRGATLRLSFGRQWVFDVATRDRERSPLDETRSRSDVLSSVEATTTIADGRRTWVLGARAEAEQLEQDLSSTEPVGDRRVTRHGSEVPGSMLGSAAVYAQLGYRPTRAVTIMPGARAELHERYGSVVVPRLAVALLPTARWTLRASGGRGFRAPSAKELGFSFDHSVYGYRVSGNADLVPETSWGVSADVTHRPWSGAMLRALVFANWIDELIDLVPAAEQATPGIDDYRYQNVGEARTAGFQIDARVSPAPWLHAEAGYAYLWTRDDTNGRPLQGRPPHTISASARADLPWRLELVLRARGVSDAFVEEHVRTPPFSLVDARLARPLGAGFAAYAGVLNAFDVHKDFARIGDRRPVAGRTFYLGLTAELPSEEEE